MIIKKTIAFDLQTRLIEQINIMRESQEYRFEDIEMIVSSLIKKFPDEKFLTEKDLSFKFSMFCQVAISIYAGMWNEVI